MRNRVLPAALVTVLFIFLALPPVGAGEPPRGRPAATLPYEVAPWFPSETWTYRVRIEAAVPSGLTTRSNLFLRHTVAAEQTVTVLGRTYTAYNSTVSGWMNAQGNLPSTGSYQIFNASVSGWTLTDRSNLARIAENQTIYARGQATVFPFVFPLWMNTSTTTVHGPAMEDYDYPLEMGDAWSFQGISNTTGFLELFSDTPIGPQWGNQSIMDESAIDLRAWFNATESVTVAAGTFPDAARIHTAAADQTADWWYHPDVRNVVRSESHVVNGPNDYMHAWANLTAYAPVSPAPWPGTILLRPQRVNPGGWITARGTAVPNEDLVVRLPASAANYPVRADPTGVWSIDLRAPAADDFTPANADVGSHGVIVEPALSPAGWNVSTVQLLPPDLIALSGDLSLSTPTPETGVPFDLNAVLRIGPDADVRSPFNVSFSVDGVEIGRMAAGNQTAGSSQAYGTTWSGPPGWHTATFVADPDGAIPETDEGNNTATRTFLVTGADLAPWNITVSHDVVDVYADPAATGYVSSPVQGRFGGSVTVTFEAANVGTRDVNASFAVAVVETAGLRGSPVGPRLLDATVPSLGAGNRTGPFTASWPVPSSPGVYHLNVTVDADLDVAEAWETNNTFAVVVNVSGPDYRIESFVAPAKVTAGSAHALNVTVRNDGQRDGNRTVPVAAFEGASPTPFATANVPPIAVGGNATVSLAWVAPSSAASPAIRFVVDPADVLDEMLETNNEASASVDVRDPPLTEIAVIGRNVSRAVLFVTSDTRYGLTATDRSGEGATAWLRIDGGPTLAYVGPFGVTAEGSHTIEYWSVDGLGGSDAVRGLNVSVDDTGPVASSPSMRGSGNRTFVTLTASDGAGVGVDRIEYRIDDGSWTVYEGEVEVVGRHNLTYRAVDLLENIGEEQTMIIVPRWYLPSAGNDKPILAAVFAAILIALGLWRQRRKAWSVASPGALGLAFGLVEAATGVASLSVGVLQMPAGFGLEIDIAVFLVGLLLVLRARSPPKPAETATTPEATESADAGTDK